jgi:hypothetical protein
MACLTTWHHPYLDGLTADASQWGSLGKPVLCTHYFIDSTATHPNLNTGPRQLQLCLCCLQTCEGTQDAGAPPCTSNQAGSGISVLAIIQHVLSCTPENSLPLFLQESAADMYTKAALQMQPCTVDNPLELGEMQYGAFLQHSMHMEVLAVVLAVIQAEVTAIADPQLRSTLQAYCEVRCIDLSSLSDKRMQALICPGAEFSMLLCCWAGSWHFIL